MSFEFHSPTTVSEVLELLGKYGKDAKILAGGTDVIPRIKAKVWDPEHIISLKKVDELHYITFDEKTGLHIGAGTPIREVEKNKVVKELYPALYEGAHAIASTQIRNFGTLVGNICNAVPSADSAPGLIVLNAKVIIKSLDKTREILVEDLFTGVCKTQLEPDELVVEIVVPRPREEEVSIYYAFTMRRALDLAVASVAANGVVNNGVVEEMKIALGAVAVTPKRAYNAEKYIVGKTLSEAVIAEAARIAAQDDCLPITDMRATAEYRREVIDVYTTNAIKHVAGLKSDLDMTVEDLR